MPISDRRLRAIFGLQAYLLDGEELGQRDGQGRKRLVRNGYLTEREIQTGIGGIPVRIPRVRDLCQVKAESGTIDGWNHVIEGIAGGMGEVDRAEDTNLSREVAIKVLPEDLSERGSQLSQRRTPC